MRKWQPKPEKEPARDFSNCAPPLNLLAHIEHQICYDALPAFVRQWVANNPEYIDCRQVVSVWNSIRLSYPNDRVRQRKEMWKIIDQATAEAAGIHNEEMEKAYK